MAVARWLEVAQGRGGDGDENGVRNYTRTWKVITDDRSDTPITIFTYGECPQKFWPCPWDQQAKCLKVQVRNTAEDGDSRHWEVTANYSTKYEQQQTSNPLTRPVKVNLDFTVFRKVVTHDLAGYPITNSAGDPPSEPVEIDAVHPVMRFTRNESTQPFALMISYAMAINSDAFYGAQPGTLRVMIKCGEEQNENDIKFYVVEYTFEYREEGWDPKYLNIGFNTYKNGKQVPIPGDSPRLLHDANPNSPFPGRTTTIASDPEFMTKRVFERKPFSVFGL